MDESGKKYLLWRRILLFVGINNWYEFRVPSPPIILHPFGKLPFLPSWLLIIPFPPITMPTLVNLFIYSMQISFWKIWVFAVFVDLVNIVLFISALRIDHPAILKTTIYLLASLLLIIDNNNLILIKNSVCLLGTVYLVVDEVPIAAPICLLRVLKILLFKMELFV